ncbi:MAG TPA: hypothetical protein VHS96_11515, partial [Bacteroidia bacterium]|nr:hypothetical protein [Bacteroidia bacterium]
MSKLTGKMKRARHFLEMRPMAVEKDGKLQESRNQASSRGSPGIAGPVRTFSVMARNALFRRPKKMKYITTT